MPRNLLSELWAWQQFAADAAIAHRFSGDKRFFKDDKRLLPTFDNAIREAEIAWSCELAQDIRDAVEAALLGVVASTSVARTLGALDGSPTQQDLDSLKSTIVRHDAIAAAAASLAQLLKADAASSAPITCYGADDADLAGPISSMVEDLEALAILAGELEPFRSTYDILARKELPKLPGQKRSRGRPQVHDYWSELAHALILAFVRAKGELPTISPASTAHDGYSGIFFRGVRPLYEVVPQGVRSLQLKTLGSRCHQMLRRARNETNAKE